MKLLKYWREWRDWLVPLLVCIFVATTSWIGGYTYGYHCGQEDQQPPCKVHKLTPGVWTVEVEGRKP